MRVVATGCTATYPDPHSFLALLRSDCSQQASQCWVRIPSTTSSGSRCVSSCCHSCQRSGENTSELMTAAALLLDGRASHRAVRAKNATVAGLRLKQRFAARTLVKILARISRHDFFSLLSAIRAGEHRFQDNGTHGFAISFDGKPASVVACVNRAVFALSGSKVTVAVFLSRSIAVALTPGTRSSAFLTTMGQVPQVIFSTARVAVCGGAANATSAATSMPNSDKDTRVTRRI